MGIFPKECLRQGVCLIIIILILFSGSVSAQQKYTSPEVLFTNLKKPTSLYVTQEHIYVAESGRHRVLKLNLLGDILDTVGGLGTGDYQLDTPIDVDATNGLKIFVSDNRNNRIQIYDKRFQYLTSLVRYPRARSSRPIRPTHLVVNNLAELFFYDQDSKSIISINDNGVKLDEFQIPGVVQEVSDMQAVGRNLYILDLKSKQYHVLSYNGLQVRSYPLEGAVQVFVDKQGEEWLISSTSIRNSREAKDEIQFPEELIIKDVVKANGVFYILTNKSVLLFYTD
ncbi:MAG: hypothetical protein JJ971_15265 [Balneolaceae bacterium]|nr:hypothetical protein [Balneolaceae bacterium]MBO6547759.1 hypothetical protein [Balneolaceae bacterium]MBO6648270.1 hypothetical protein [Balneolaceae bacterium]